MNAETKQALLNTRTGATFTFGDRQALLLCNKLGWIVAIESSNNDQGYFTVGPHSKEAAVEFIEDWAKAGEHTVRVILAI